MHPRDNDRLLATLRSLARLGNTVVVVEHDESTMRAADHLVDFGPGPGVKGGEVVAHGMIADLAHAPQSLTGAYLTGKTSIPIPKVRRTPDGRAADQSGHREIAFDERRRHLQRGINLFSCACIGQPRRLVAAVAGEQIRLGQPCARLHGRRSERHRLLEQIGTRGAEPPRASTSLSPA